MRQVYLLGLLAILGTGFSSTSAFAQEPNDDDDENAQQETEKPKEADLPTQKPEAAKPAAEPMRPVEAAPVIEPVAKPKFGDTTVTGYLRGSFGASSEKGRMTCFSLALPGGLKSKYRLGNECEIWSETHFTTTVYAGSDGTVAHIHFMPTVFLPNTGIGYSPNATISSPVFSTANGATLSFPNLYVDLQNVPWLAGGTLWAGNRYYKRESVYISDFFYWNPSGMGVGIEDIHLGKDLRLSYGAFAVDGDPVSGQAPNPSLPAQSDFGVRNDFQLRGIRPYASGEFQVGVQVIANYSNNPATHGGGFGVTLQHVQQLFGGENKLAVQYGRGGGTGFGTLARFYYPDFSLRQEMKESRLRIVEVLTVQPTPWFGAQGTFVYQHDDLGTANSQQDWISAGARLGWAFTEHAKILGEAGWDHVKKNNGLADGQMLAKFTIAPAITAGRAFLNRPEIRLFYTWCMWNEAARTAGIDSGSIYNATNKLSGAIYGMSAETWW